MKKLLIIHDALKNNLDEIDTLEQADFVRKSTDFVSEIFFADMENLKALVSKINAFKPDFIFNLVENRAIHIIPSFLDSIKVKYTGNSGKSIFLTTDKLLFKRMMPKKMIPSFVTSDTGNAVKGKQYIIKSVFEDASIGIDEDSVIVAESTKQVRELIKKKKTCSFAEEFIKGREINLALLEGKNKIPEILIPREVVFTNFPLNKPQILCYKSKWESESFEYKNTKTIANSMKNEPELLSKITKYAKYCWKKFELRGYARVDFRIDEKGNPFVLEVNANPCINPEGSGFYKSFVEMGYEPKELIKRIIDAVKR